MAKHYKKKYILAEDVVITSLSHTGKGIGRIDNKVVFVEDTVPNDIADIQIVKNKKDYAEARLTNLKKASDLRIEPTCNHFGICGGCRLMNLPYEFQLKHKESLVIEDFKRISHLTDYKIHPVIGAEKVLGYRNKLEFTFSRHPWFVSKNDEADSHDDRRVLGFHVRGRFDKVVDIQQCHLQEEPANLIRNTFGKLARQYDFEFYDQKKNTGFIRTLIIRMTKTSEIMVIVVFTADQHEIIRSFLTEALRQLPPIHSLYYFINPKVNDSIYDLEPNLFHGNTYITERTGHIRLQVGPKSFLQTNSHQAEILYNQIEKICGLTGEETVYDLYCGVGSIGLYLAHRCKKIIGIEAIPESIEEAQANMQLNGIANANFLAGQSEKVLTPDFIATYGKPDVIILDPPRAGLHKDLIATLCQIKPEKLLYVSCNPSTQARDAALLSESFQLIEIQPIDMFPHTLHVENITLFKSK